MSIQTPHLTPEEAAAYLKLPSIRALYRLIKLERLPYGRVGRLLRFDTRQLDRWIAVRTVKDDQKLRSA